ncbi:MAG: FKBP-type peptidyl-prolyl cis-trans isomerase [Crocinitomicaceae bacterium]|nr:FKBP-type peptidyl-prolyl cis-trans isomerase [Crocinitomicaceae bacterium]
MSRSFYILFLLFLVSCGGSKPDPIQLHDDKEPELIFDNYDQKISYCIGLDHARGCFNAYSNPQISEHFDMAQIEAGMIDYIAGNELRIDFMSIDSILDLYLVEDGSIDNSKVNKSDASYAIGLDEAFNLVSALVGRQIDQDVDVEFMIIGIQQAMDNAEHPSIAYMDAKREVINYYGDVNKKNGEAFLKENIMYQGVQVTESGLQYEIIKEGNGIQPYMTDSVIIHYTGRFIDGRVFESTIPSNIPFKGSLMSVIPGWQEGVCLMKEGGQTRLYIPYELAYGAEGKGVVEPYSTLIFDIELIKVMRFK